MIDIYTYKTLHASSTLANRNLRADLNKETMARNEPPEGDFVLLVPPTIIGYNLRLKKWGKSGESRGHVSIADCLIQLT